MYSYVTVTLMVGNLPINNISINKGRESLFADCIKNESKAKSGSFCLVLVAVTISR